MSFRLRLGVTVTWYLVLAVWLRFWDLTQRVPALMLWTLVGTVLYVATARAVHGPLRAQRRVLTRAAGWGALVVVVAIVVTIVPHATLGSARVNTSVFEDLLDGIVPAWIGMSAVAHVWTGAAKVAAPALVPPVLLVALWIVTVRMPGRSHRGELAPLASADAALRDSLRAHVHLLASVIGERSDDRLETTQAAADSIEARLRRMGLSVARRPFPYADRSYHNLEVEWRGSTRPEDIVVVGAHYDTAEGAPGADDNASGAAGLLEVARHLAQATPPARTVRAVFFASEEPPFFATEWMGSAVYAREAAARGDRIVAMLSLETIGYYDTTAGSQRYPPPFSFFYPDRGHFVGFVSDIGSGPLVRRTLAAFRRAAPFPSEGAAAPSWVSGVGWSDHMPFWVHGYRAIMITDTAPFRNPYYHTPYDTMDKLDFDRMARVVRGVFAVVDDLAASPGGQ
ncbi:MAG: M20/M25/M40 family metallo-hydrolase [Gemmatimonadetes bacterium]|nr:M20/M25/M40 family metallo-hydrolase [Gemmatimonadota bacterium]